MISQCFTQKPLKLFWYSMVISNSKQNPELFQMCTNNYILYLWKVSSGSESVRLLAPQAENSTSGWGSFWERSRLGSWFSMSVMRNVPGVVPENVRICGFRRNSSNLESAPKMRDSVLLNSWDSFIVTLPSISSETCAI